MDNIYGTIGGGLENEATGDYSTICGGRNAKTYNYGQLAYASGSFANNGDAQTSVYVLRNQTGGSQASNAELFLNGNDMRMRLKDHDAWAFRIIIIGKNSSGTYRCAFSFNGMINREGNNTIAYGISPHVLYRSSNALSAQVTADNINNSLKIVVIGPSPIPIHWVARVDVVQVNFGN